MFIRLLRLTPSGPVKIYYAMCVLTWSEMVELCTEFQIRTCQILMMTVRVKRPLSSFSAIWGRQVLIVFNVTKMEL